MEISIYLIIISMAIDETILSKMRLALGKVAFVN